MMDISLQDLPVIDWNQSLKLVGHQQAIAEELLGLLVKNLPNDMSAIQHAYSTHDLLDLQKKVHKLHGAISYCGVPRLKKIIVHLETNLKNNIIEDLPAILHQLNDEARLVVTHQDSSNHK